MSFLRGPDSPGAGIVFFPAFQSAELPPIQDDQENDWFAGTMQCFTSVALAAAVVASSLAAQIGTQAANWDQGDIAYGPTVESLGTFVPVFPSATVNVRYFGGDPDEVPNVQAEYSEAPPVVVWSQPLPVLPFLDDSNALPILSVTEDAPWVAPTVWPVPAPGLPVFDDGAAAITLGVDETDWLPPVIYQHSQIQLLSGVTETAAEADITVEETEWLAPPPWPRAWVVRTFTDDSAAVQPPPSLGIDEDPLPLLVIQPQGSVCLLVGGGSHVNQPVAAIGINDEPWTVINRLLISETVLYGPWSYAASEDACTLTVDDSDPQPVCAWPEPEPVVIFGPWAYGVSEDIGSSLTVEDESPFPLLVWPRPQPVPPLSLFWDSSEIVPQPPPLGVREDTWIPVIVWPAPSPRLALYDAVEITIPGLAEEEQWAHPVVWRIKAPAQPIRDEGLLLLFVPAPPVPTPLGEFPCCPAPVFSAYVAATAAFLPQVAAVLTPLFRTAIQPGYYDICVGPVAMFTWDSSKLTWDRSKPTWDRTTLA